MQKPPRKGFLVSQADPRFKIYVEDVFTDEEEPGFLVTYCEAASKDRPGDVGFEANDEEWAAFVSEHRLIPLA